MHPNPGESEYRSEGSCIGLLWAGSGYCLLPKEQHQNADVMYCLD